MLCFLGKAGDALISFMGGEGEKMSSGIKYFEVNMAHMNIFSIVLHDGNIFKLVQLCIYIYYII